MHDETFGSPENIRSEDLKVAVFLLIFVLLMRLNCRSVDSIPGKPAVYSIEDYAYFSST